MSACLTTPRVNGRAGGSGSAPIIASLWEAEFANQGNVVFADGPQNITGIDGRVLGFTVANSDRAQAGTVANWGFESGVGLNWLASVTSGSWTAAAKTASRLTIPTATLLTTFDLDFTARIIVELHFSLISFVTGTPLTGVGFDGTAGAPANSGNRVWYTNRSFQAATLVSNTTTTPGISSNYTTAPGPTADVVATMMIGNGFTGMIGQATIGPPFVWPRLRTVVSAGSQSDSSFNTLSGTSMGFIFASNSVAGTSRVRVSRIRIRSAA